MSDDDDGDCPGHMWRLTGVALISGHGAPTEYACERPNCDAALYVGPDDVMPASI